MMVENRKISSYFKRSESTERQLVAGVKRPGSKDGPPSSSPLTPCPPDYSSVQFTSPILAPKQLQVLEDRSRHAGESEAIQSTPMDEPEPYPAVSSFASVPGSQRVLKDGEIMITASDDDDDYSINSITISTDDLLARFLATPRQKESSDTDMPASKGRKAKGKANKGGQAATGAIPKFSLDDLVADATQDKEREAQVSAAKILLKESAGQSKGKGKHPSGRDDIYASLVSDTSDTAAIRRLKDAVSRTEAFQEGTSWSFFREDPPKATPQSFPGKSIYPGSWEAVLRVATEPRDELRFAYTSALHPDTPNLDDEEPPPPLDTTFLLSVLTLLAGLAEKLNPPTREHTLKILFRLALDETVMNDGAVSAETQRAIVSLFGDPEPALSGLNVYELAEHVYGTVKDTNLQSLLLKHIPPVSPELALFRCRLATAFLFRDSSPLDKPAAHLINIQKLSSQLKSDRFKANEHRSEDRTPFNFAELVALTTILDIAIDSGTLQPSFPSKEAEMEFNKQVDKLADRVKTAFTAIQDSGASHMKRTEAKEGLQALHYRLIHTVRTRPVQKKSWFISPNEEGRIGPGKKDILEKFLGVK
ncbi:uncharacterized protein GIQ15_00920 [Arthroderma uncinatum]|uniref:uncharacterized protein n=1 Tax=Arthroderma uncinatum TaxID=74035 RepID=UPI00144AB185|nr:uncharacterized protein GIQ15_00920 [Arthroderma uncinatum]KAF3491403.1 hypothetical protein GIQ15_00920 [Arthroderma uncinatum]